MYSMLSVPKWLVVFLDVIVTSLSLHHATVPLNCLRFALLIKRTLEYHLFNQLSTRNITAQLSVFLHHSYISCAPNTIDLIIRRHQPEHLGHFRKALYFKFKLVK
jgi:hypothetical protein